MKQAFECNEKMVEKTKEGVDFDNQGDFFFEYARREKKKEKVMSNSFILQKSSKVLTSIIIEHQTRNEQPTRWILYISKNVYRPDRIVRLFVERTGKVGWVTVSYRPGHSYRFYVSRSVRCVHYQSA